MTWQTRLKEAAYTAADGNRLTFDFVDVKRTFAKKTAGFEFPDSDNTYVQDNGVTSFQFPLRVFFHGANYDLDAAAFENALRQKGVGKLEHPMYGSFDTIPFGSVTRRDDLVTAGNQAIIEVVFWQTLRNAYPASQVDPASLVVTAVAEFNVSSSETFNDSVDLESSVEQQGFKNTYSQVLNTSANLLRPIANTTESVQTQFNAILDSINSGIDTLVGDPLTLALQTLQLIQSPGRAVTTIRTKLEVYESLAGLVISRPASTFNDFQGDKLFATGYVSAQIVSALNSEFETRPEALLSAEVIVRTFNTVNSWVEENYTNFEELDTGEDYQQLQEAVSIAAGFLVELSFDLRVENRIVIDRARTIIDLVGELYGVVDSELDFFILSNNLSGSEILELPKGREIVYYA
jgi:hypothetical protein